MDNDAIVRELLRRNRRRWPWVLLAIVLFSAVVFGIVRYTLHRRVVVELARIRADGYPTTLAELDAWYPTPSGANAADVYLEAFDAYVEDEELEALLPGFSADVDWPAPDEPIPPEMLEAMDAYLAQNAEALVLVAEAASIPECRFPVDFEEGFDVSLPHLFGLRQAERLLALQASVAAEQRQIKSVVGSIKTMLALAESLKHEPTLISQLVRRAIRAVACETVEQALDRGQWTDVQLADLSQIFEDAIDRGAIARAMVGERVTMLSAFDMMMPSRGRAAFGKVTGLTDAERSAYLNILDATIQKAENPLGHPADIDAMSRDLPWCFDVARGIMPAMEAVFRSGLRADAELQTLLVGLATKRYELAPEYLDAVPVDSFDGKPLRYKLTDTGAVIYSRGSDGTDDGGSEMNAQGQAYGDGIDIIFTVRQ